MNIGAHIPKEKTIIKTLENIKENDGNVLQLFTTNPRSLTIYDNSKYLKESHLIKKYCKINNINIIVHSPYVLNIAKPFKLGKKDIDIIDTLIFNDITTANIINAIGYIIHVGKSLNNDIEDSLLIMKNNIKNIIAVMLEYNIRTKLILETPAGQGTELLTDFNDFINFYYLYFTDSEREVFKLCIDTCHIWNAGYELNEILKLIPNKDDIICIHLNNSKTIKGSRVDRHETIFKGKIEPIELKRFAKEFEKSYIILEKPDIEYNKEINYIIN
jgi:deoxyribonuclease-4